MDAFVVRAGGPLSGTVRVSGATKNAGLKQMAAALLAPGVTVLRNVDPVLDLDAMLDVMRAIGADTRWTGENDDLIADLQRSIIHAGSIQLSRAAPFDGPTLRRSVFIRHFDVNECMWIAKHELHQLPLEFDLFAYIVGRAVGMMCIRSGTS